VAKPLVFRSRRAARPVLLSGSAENHKSQPSFALAFLSVIPVREFASRAPWNIRFSAQIHSPKMLPGITRDQRIIEESFCSRLPRRQERNLRDKNAPNPRLKRT
jgi:hypothetical protein